jgi:diguanylate cyclase (GGDEF)-like protein
MTVSQAYEPKNPLIEKYRPRFEGPDAGKPLSYAEAAEIFFAYQKLDKRLARIARISDNFQAELQKLKEELEYSSRTDYLTGLSNRRDIYERLVAEQSRSARNGKVFSVIMADFDQFKGINDTYGHAIGDQFLVASAGIFKENLRREDCCARWGGEEFLILLPETEGSSALTVAEKLRQLVAEKTLVVDGSRVRATLSFGLSVYRGGETDIDACLSRADEALYQAKSGGRNRSVLLDREPSTARP